MRIKLALAFLSGICIFSISSMLFAEDITITTYYPSPYGSYVELKAKKMAIGTTFYQYPFTDQQASPGCLDNETCFYNSGIGYGYDLVVEGDARFGKTGIRDFAGAINPGRVDIHGPLYIDTKGFITGAQGGVPISPSDSYNAFIDFNGTDSNSNFYIQRWNADFTVGGIPTPDSRRYPFFISGGNGSIGLGNPVFDDSKYILYVGGMPSLHGTNGRSVVISGEDGNVPFPLWGIMGQVGPSTGGNVVIVPGAGYELSDGGIAILGRHGVAIPNNPQGDVDFLQINGGTARDGANGGSIEIYAQSGGATDGNGGTVVIGAGSGQGAGKRGDVGFYSYHGLQVYSEEPQILFYYLSHSGITGAFERAKIVTDSTYNNAIMDFYLYGQVGQNPVKVLNLDYLNGVSIPGNLTVSGSVSFPGGSSGKIVCQKSDGKLGYCGDDPKSSNGTCSCN